MTEKGEQMEQNDGALVRVVEAPMAAPAARESVFLPAMSMEIALARRSAVVEFGKRIMTLGSDFGVIPGTDKPTLLKPGAEKLTSFFGFEPKYQKMAEEIDWTGAQHGGEPLYYIRYLATLEREGRVFGSGEGSANTWESKHRYRWVAEDKIPMGVDRSTLTQRGGRKTIFEPDFAIDKADTSGKYGKPSEYWARFHQAIGEHTAKRAKKTLGKKEYDGWQIDMDETQFRVPNPEFADLINTCQKMAQKRALIAATLIATSASEFYTQDLEDIPEFSGRMEQAPPARPEPEPEPEPEPQTPPPPRSAPKSAPSDPGWRARFQGTCVTERKRLGDSLYFQCLGLYGFTRGGDVPDSVTARKIEKELIERATPPYQATDEDVPEEIGGRP